jgi:hypothetical protein
MAKSQKSTNFWLEFLPSEMAVQEVEKTKAAARLKSGRQVPRPVFIWCTEGNGVCLTAMFADLTQQSFYRY